MLPPSYVPTFLLFRIKWVETLSVAHVTYVSMEVFTTCGAGRCREREEKEGEKEMGEREGKEEGEKKNEEGKGGGGGGGRKEKKQGGVRQPSQLVHISTHIIVIIKHTCLQMGTLPSLQMDTTGT